MTTETTLLLMLTTGIIFASPGIYALWRSRWSHLSIQAAEQLETQLKVRLDNMHTRILTLESERADLDRRMDAMQVQSDLQQTEIAHLKRQNSGLATMVKRLIAQLERHELVPEVTSHDLSRLLS